MLATTPHTTTPCLTSHLLSPDHYHYQLGHLLPELHVLPSCYHQLELTLLPHPDHWDHWVEKVSSFTKVASLKTIISPELVSLSACLYDPSTNLIHVTEDGNQVSVSYAASGYCYAI
jgi:hypothetical protein